MRQHYRAVWLVDFEFHQPDGERPVPLCMVAREYFTGRMIRQWIDAVGALPDAPFDLGDDTLVVAYYASAELGCYQALGWPLPSRVLDLYAEFRNHTNGHRVPCGNGLLGALQYFGLDGIGDMEKAGMRELAMRGGSYTMTERKALLDYCESDVAALSRLLPAMEPHLDLGRGLLRGRFMTAAAKIEATGTPIDVDVLHRLKINWAAIQDRLIDVIDRDYGAYEGRTFKVKRWHEYLVAHGIPWPLRESGELDLSDDAFRSMARVYPNKVGPMRELRQTLSQLTGLTMSAAIVYRKSVD